MGDEEGQGCEERLGGEEGMGVEEGLESEEGLGGEEVLRDEEGLGGEEGQGAALGGACENTNWNMELSYIKIKQHNIDIYCTRDQKTGGRRSKVCNGRRWPAKQNCCQASRMSHGGNGGGTPSSSCTYILFVYTPLHANIMSQIYSTC